MKETRESTEKRRMERSVEKEQGRDALRVNDGLGETFGSSVDGLGGRIDVDDGGRSGTSDLAVPRGVLEQGDVRVDVD